MIDLKQKIITIIGKTNTGKSTLFNKLINRKYSITTKKKNTTIDHIIYNIKENNTILIDTPGPIINKTNKNINTIIYDSILQSSLILIVINNLILETEDHFILELIEKYKKQNILVINKIDKLNQKDIILPFIKKITSKYKNILQIIPLSATKDINIDTLKTIIKNDKNIIYTNFEKKVQKIDLRSIIKDITRETLLIKLKKEIPYLTHINIMNEKLNKNTKNIIIKLDIKKHSHKKIIIGKYGQKINDIIYDIKRKTKKFCNNLQDIKIIMNLKK